jgi:hypothetical protein
LRSTVRSKPGVFVRASQDLNQAGLDRSRLDKYLAAVKNISDSDPKALRDSSIVLARGLGIRLDPQCFERPAEQQASCLTQNTANLVLDDGHSQSMVAALTSGPSSDLIGAVSSTSLAGGGFYSAYVGAIVDVARIMGSIHTASYQYIPALALPQQEQMNLKLNNPPSFRKPMSVLVIGLPAVEAAQLPPLRPANSQQIFCLQKSSLVLPVEGAPLVFSTDIAHGFTLHLQSKAGTGVDLPAKADAMSGGFLIDTHSLDASKLDPDVSGTLHGYWGFDHFDGPVFHLRAAHAVSWTVPPADQSALIVGRDDDLHLQSECAACVDGITLQTAKGKSVKANWKLTKPDELEVKVPLKEESAGPVKMIVKQFGLTKPDEVSLRAYSEAAHLESFTINAGDRDGILKGTRLDEVEHFDLKGTAFAPEKLSRRDEKDELHVTTTAAPPLQPEEKVVAHVALKDGRILELQTRVESPRPKVTLLSKNVQLGAAPSTIHLGSQDELPQDGKISFLLKAETPNHFSRGMRIEVATADESFSVQLTLTDGSLVLRDSESLFGILDPLKAFGPSAFGPLRFRPIDADGNKGDWQALATLVRMPALQGIQCPDGPDVQCKLTGTNLFLIDSIASEAEFTRSVPVPIGFMDTTLPVPRPNGTLLYLKLRDDPATVSSAALPVLPEN